MTAYYFFIITILSVLLFYRGTGKDNYFLLIFSPWLLISGGLALAGVFEHNPVYLPIAMLVTISLTIAVVRKSARQVLDPKALLAVHVLRVPVELVLYALYLQKKIPVLMTFTGWNFDILMGISAIILLFFMLWNGRLSPRFFLAWNITGLFFLFFIVLLAILSSPLPVQQFAFDQPNVAVLSFPYCFLPFVVVPVVLMSHLLLIKELRSSGSVN
jgi:hypothetical protein